MCGTFYTSYQFLFARTSKQTFIEYSELSDNTSYVSGVIELPVRDDELFRTYLSLDYIRCLSSRSTIRENVPLCRNTNRLLINGSIQHRWVWFYLSDQQHWKFVPHRSLSIASVCFTLVATEIQAIRWNEDATQSR